MRKLQGFRSVHDLVSGRLGASYKRNYIHQPSRFTVSAELSRYYSGLCTTVMRFLYCERHHIGAGFRIGNFGVAERWRYPSAWKTLIRMASLDRVWIERTFAARSLAFRLLTRISWSLQFRGCTAYAQVATFSSSNVLKKTFPGATQLSYLAIANVSCNHIPETNSGSCVLQVFLNIKISHSMHF